MDPLDISVPGDEADLPELQIVREVAKVWHEGMVEGGWWLGPAETLMDLSPRALRGFAQFKEKRAVARKLPLRAESRQVMSRRQDHLWHYLDQFAVDRQIAALLETHGMEWMVTHGPGVDRLLEAYEGLQEEIV